MNKEKEKKIKQLINDYISDCEVVVEDINPTGYREYDYTAYPVINVDWLVEDIKKIIEE